MSVTVIAGIVSVVVFLAITAARPGKSLFGK